MSLTAKQLRAAILCWLLLGATLTGCPDVPAEQRAARSGLRLVVGDLGWRNGLPDWAVYHDDARSVTCFAASGARELAISCLPDSHFGSAATAAEPPQRELHP